MKTTDKIALLCFAIGAAAAGGLIYLDPPWHWGWSLGAGLVIASIGYQEITKQTAAERIVNRDVSAKN